MKKSELHHLIKEQLQLKDKDTLEFWKMYEKIQQGLITKGEWVRFVRKFFDKKLSSI